MPDTTTLGAKDHQPAANVPHTRAVRADIGWDKAPCIRLWDPDGNELRYPLTPAEAAAMLRRLAGYLQHLLRDSV